jgi:transposase-like protein
MNARTPAKVPTPLSLTRRLLDQWRKRQRGRKRLPREFWAKAVTLAREHGINKTARTLGVKYESLKKHLEARPAASGPATAGPEFLELVPGTMVPSSLECTIELEDSRGGKMRMQVKGASIADLASFARGGRDGQA